MLLDDLVNSGDYSFDVADLNSYMPCKYSYNEKYNEIEIQGIATNMYLYSYDLTKNGDKGILKFKQKENDKAEVVFFVSYPFDKAENVQKAIAIQLVTITKTLEGKVDGKFNLESKNFKGLLDATVGTVNRDLTTNILVQFLKEENDQVSLTVYTGKDEDGNYVKYIGNDISDYSVIKNKKCTLTVKSEDNLEPSTNVEELDDFIL